MLALSDYSTMYVLHYRVLDRFYRDLEPLFSLDPLTLQTFLYICPRAELKTVFGLIPPNVSIAWVSYMINTLFANIECNTVSCMGSFDISRWFLV